MKVGVISDTHDCLEAVDSAVNTFRRLEVERILHAGDWVAPFTLVRLAKSGIPLAGVLGNNEAEIPLLTRRAAEHGVKLERYTFSEGVGGRRIIVYHGTDSNILEALIECGLYDVVIYGHTHRTDVRRVKDTLVVNPGEASGVLYGERTIAVVDLEELTAEIIRI